MTCTMYDFQVTSVLHHISITVAFIVYCLLSHRLLQTANPSFFILLEKPGVKGIVDQLIDLQEHKATYAKVWVWVMAK